MEEAPVVHTLFLIFTGAAVLAGVALLARQSLLVAYIALGVGVGPHGLALVTDAPIIQSIGEIGIIFLLYLLGLNLHPQKLVQLLREATLVTVASSLAFAGLGFAIAVAFGFEWIECLLIGAAMMFSSTIIGLKLLPTTALHHRHVGEVIISVLLLQDVIAILILLGLDAYGAQARSAFEIVLRIGALPALTVAAFVAERFVLRRVLARFDTIQEYVFLTAIGWCLGVAQLGHVLGLSYEIGAFVAGVALASSPIATFIAESLKPLRDFFLILFFFALGAGFALDALPQTALPAGVLAITMLIAKPWVFERLLAHEHESAGLAAEVGTRLGQVSEFSLLIAVLALQSGAIGVRAGQVIQTATLITFIVSAYWVMLRYPTPIGVSRALRRD